MKLLEFCMKHRYSRNLVLRIFAGVGIRFFKADARRIQRELKARTDMPAVEMPSADELLRRAGISRRSACKHPEV
ncbi:MAG TPA: hypothetical protein IAB44_14865 [Candidatus Limivivens intestinipullorum]|uniref:Uncharacterized protein n=1 Tax=Candidatus Limivivens intestinipullorum TaxID=2840858 RepID=A0A9D1JL18_9FIRM|nr:hypothetical protein [Candidatus Limivivens intestinipullorum]